MNSEFVQAWWPVVAFGLSAIGFVASLLVKSSVSKETADLRKEVANHHDRLTKIEGAISVLPNRDDMHTLSQQNAELVGELKALKVQVSGVADTMKATQQSVQRINDYLLNDKAHS